MCDKLKIKLQQTTHALDVLAYNQRLFIDNTSENDLFALLKRYAEQRQIVAQLESQLKSVALKTKSQSQQIQDQRQRRLNSANRADRLLKTIQKIYSIINYRGNHTSPIDQLHHIKHLCGERLRDDILSDDEDEDELDSRNCTIDDDQNESIIIHPRVVLPQLATKKRSLPADEDDLQKVHSPPKRLRFDDTQQIIPSPTQRIITQTTFECYASKENTTRPFTVSTDIQMIDHSCNEQHNRLTINSDDSLSLSSTTINSTQTASSSSIEQTLLMTPTKTSTNTHRFVSRKVFKPETCFVCLKRITFGSISYRCSYCSQSCHVNCKETAGFNCKALSNNALLPPYSPKPSINTPRQRAVNSEPQKIAISTARTSTIPRHLPFERMVFQKSTNKYFPPV